MRTRDTFLTEARFTQMPRGLAYSADFGGVFVPWDDDQNDYPGGDVGAGFMKEAISCPLGDFFTLRPCRILDTRDPGNSPLFSTWSRSYVAVGACGIPPTASAVALNVTAISPTSAGYLTLHAANQSRPPTSTINFGAGQTRGNNAIVGLSFLGAFSIYPLLGGGGVVNVVVDVTGYFN